MENRSNCFVCGKAIVYQTNYRKAECSICKKSYETNTQCEDLHFVCDGCHSFSANEIITTYCLNSKETNALEMAIKIMRHPSVKMHGPEHHYLVPAVLLTAYFNITERNYLLKEKLIIAEKRAKNILGGFCGFYGNCGAGVGAGIFISIITESTPLSEKGWKLSNLATAFSLKEIAEHGGPRCCKRDTYITIEEMTNFLKENFNIEINNSTKITCNFSGLNKECKTIYCKFYA